MLSTSVTPLAKSPETQTLPESQLDTFKGLPEKIKQCIFSELSVKDAARANLVCREWNSIISNQSFQKRLLAGDFEARRKQLDTNIANGIFHRQILSGKSTPIIHADGMLIYGRGPRNPTLYIHHMQTDKRERIRQINGQDERSGYAPAYQMIKLNKTAFHFDIFTYAAGLIIAADFKSNALVAYDVKSLEQVYELSLGKSTSHERQNILLGKYANGKLCWGHYPFWYFTIWDFRCTSRTAIQPLARRKSVDSDGTSIMDTLPNELIEHILGKLDVRSAETTRLVCRKWHQIVSGDALWKHFLQRDFMHTTSGTKNPRDTYLLQSNLRRCKYRVHDHILTNGSLRVHALCFAESNVFFATNSAIYCYDPFTKYGYPFVDIKIHLRTDAQQLVYADGKLLILDENDQIWVHNPGTFNTIPHSSGHQGILSMTHADGKIFTGTSDHQLKIYDLKGKLINTFDISRKGIPNRLHYERGVLFCSFSNTRSEIWDFNSQLTFADIPEQTLHCEKVLKKYPSNPTCPLTYPES